MSDYTFGVLVIFGCFASALMLNHLFLMKAPKKKKTVKPQEASTQESNRIHNITMVMIGRKYFNSKRMTEKYDLEIKTKHSAPLEALIRAMLEAASENTEIDSSLLDYFGFKIENQRNEKQKEVS